MLALLLLALLQRHSPLLAGPLRLPPTRTFAPSAHVRTNLKDTGVPALCIGMNREGGGGGVSEEAWGVTDHLSKCAQG